MEAKDEEKGKNNSEEREVVSRRKWLIDLGKAAALAGITGKAGPLDAQGVAGSTSSEAGPERGLPAGLYRPSSGHLGRALEDDSRFHSIPLGCEVDFLRPRTKPFEPQFFSADEYKVIRRLTALMLGESTNASEENSKAADQDIVDEVAQWIDLHTYSFAGVRETADRLSPEQAALAEAYNGAPLLHRVRTADPQKTYRDGLAWMAEESERRYQHGFLELSEQQQTAILDLISDDGPNKEADNEGTHLFMLLKRDIISGFYTSRIGLEELDYMGNRFYAASPGCSSFGHLHQKAGK